MVKKFFALRKQAVTKVEFKAQVSNGDLELQVYDVIGADIFGQGVTAANISEAIAEAGQFNTITLRINSPGGDAFEGISIYNLLRATKKPINVYVDGLAASAASIIAMAGDKVTMGVGAMIMIHNAMMIAYGNGNDFREAAGVLDTVSSSIADIYVASTDVPKNKVQKMMDDETWMDASEAVENGFADATDESSAPQAKSDFDLSVYNNVPDSLKTPDLVAAEPVIATTASVIVAEPVVEAPVEEDGGWNIDLKRKRLELQKKA